MNPPARSGHMVIKGAPDAQRFLMIFDLLPKPFTLAWTPGERRTIPQNSLLHKWFGEVASHLGDTSAAKVKGQCHREWGLSIRLRDPEFAWVWNKTGAHLSYEKQCNMLGSGVLGVSSKFTKHEFSEYMDAMRQHFEEINIHLTDPDARNTIVKAHEPNEQRANGPEGAAVRLG